MMMKLQAAARETGREAKTRGFWLSLAKGLFMVVLMGSMLLLFVSQIPDMLDMILDGSEEMGAPARFTLVVLGLASPAAIVCAVFQLFVWRCQCECERS